MKVDCALINIQRGMKNGGFYFSTRFWGFKFNIQWFTFKKMDIRLLLNEDTIKCYNIDFNTANALGINTARNKKPNEKAVKTKLIKLLKELDSKTVSFLVENVTIKDQEHDKIGFWRLRIHPDIPIYDHFIFNNQTVFF